MNSRCIGLNLAYGMMKRSIAREAVRSFFLASRDRLTAILKADMGVVLAEQLATDALLRLEGATLWLATMDDQAPWNALSNR